MTICIPILVFISVVYFHNVATAKSIFIERDLSGFFVPPKYIWVALVKSFSIPLWNPYNYSGIPLLATLQPGVFYPPHVFYLFLPFNVVWNWLIILHFVFAGVAVLFFLRHMKASIEASFVGGIVFMFSGYLLSVHNLLPHLFSVSWFPLVLMFFLMYLERGRLKYVVLTSLCISMQFFAGAPEIVMMTLLVMVVLSFLYPVFSDGPVVNFYLRIKALLIVFLLFFLVCAIQFLPFYELSSNSIRKGGLAYREATTWSFAWKDFIQFFIPNPYGYFQSDAKYWTNQGWLKTVYLGIMPFVLSIFYFISKDKKKILFLLLMLISFIFALGGNTPFYKILYHIPPFNSVRYPVKFLFVFFFVIAITSGLGYDRLKEGIRDKDPYVKKLILTVFYIGFLFALAWGYVALFRPDVYSFFERHNIKPDAYNDIDFNIHSIKRFLLFSFLFCTMLLLSLRTKYKKIALLGVIALITTDLFLSNYGYYNTTSWEYYMGKNEFVNKIHHAETGRYIITPDTDKEFKVFPEDRRVFKPYYAALFGSYTAGGMEVLRIGDYENFTNILYSTKSLEEAKRYLDISGIAYLVTINNIEDKEFRRLESIRVGEKPVYLYEYLKSPGRFLLFDKAVYVANAKAAVEKLTDNAIDLRSTLILVGKNKGPNSPLPHLAKGKNREGAAGTTTLVSYNANKVVIECDANTGAFLYVSDTYYPGWKAYIDGKETEIYRANLAFRAVEVPAGKHRVTFKYVPFSFYLGLVLTCIGIAACCYLIKRDNMKP